MSHVTICGTWNFILGIFYFNQPMKKVVHFPHPSIQKQSVFCSCQCPKQTFAALSDGTVKNLLNDKDSDNIMVM